MQKAKLGLVAASLALPFYALADGYGGEQNVPDTVVAQQREALRR